MDASFYIVELSPKKLGFDFYCSKRCVLADGGRDLLVDAENVTPAESLERTGTDGQDRECWRCNGRIYRLPDHCPTCDGQGALLGKLGSLTWLRCINCGWEFTAPAEQLYVDIDALATPGNFIVSE